MSGLVFIISAPSGSGKSTLVNEIRRVIGGLEFSVSYTTRKPRGSEQPGCEYFFIERDEFERMIDKKAFLEHAEVFGNYYGTARHFMDDAHARGNDLLLDIDVQGAAQVQDKLPEAISIFILAPSRGELELRLRRRSSQENATDEETIKRRLKTASREIENYGKYDYILVNNRLEESIEALKAIVLSERIRHEGRQPLPEEQAMFDLADSHRLAAMRESIQSILATFGPESQPAGV
jgi:guanylate kinase